MRIFVVASLPGCVGSDTLTLEHIRVTRQREMVFGIIHANSFLSLGFQNAHDTTMVMDHKKRIMVSFLVVAIESG